MKIDLRNEVIRQSSSNSPTNLAKPYSASEKSLSIRSQLLKNLMERLINSVYSTSLGGFVSIC
jgi:hypothetical protein